MRRRVDDGAGPPVEHLGFPGWLVYTDAKVWERDYGAWQERRRARAAGHGIQESDLPAAVGDAPFDWDLV
jgi:hypothetical protein